MKEDDIQHTTAARFRCKLHKQSELLLKQSKAEMPKNVMGPISHHKLLDKSYSLDSIDSMVVQIIFSNVLPLFYAAVKFIFS